MFIFDYGKNIGRLGDPVKTQHLDRIRGTRFLDPLTPFIQHGPDLAGNIVADKGISNFQDPFLDQYRCNGSVPLVQT